MWPNPQEIAELVTFTEEILDGNFIILCSVQQNRRFCPWTGEYGSVKTRLLEYFMQYYGVHY